MFNKVLTKIVALTLVLHCQTIMAQTNVNNLNEQRSEQDSVAAQTLRSKLSLLQTFTAKFEQEVTDFQGQVLQTSSGIMSLKQPNLLVWDVTAPDENRMIADGKTLWYVDPFVEQVTALDQQSSVANNPIVLLTDPSNQAWQDFTIVQQDGGFLVTSLNGGAQIVELSLYFDGDILTSMTFVDSQRQTSRLKFNDVQQNRPLGNDLFIFDLPAGFDLDDQR